MQAPNSFGTRLLFHRIVIFAVVGLFAAIKDVRAGTPYTQSTVGFTINALSGSSTYISLPVTPAPVFCGTVSSAGGTTINVNGSPSPGGQACYIVITSGTKQGATYSVSSVSGSAVTIDAPLGQYCDDLTGINPGDGVAIIPCWTLGTLFPGGTGVTGGPNVGLSTQIFIFNVVTQTFEVFYFKTAGLGGSGWRSAASAIIDRTSQIIQPYQTIIVLQHSSGPNLSFTVTGSEIENQSRTCLLIVSTGTVPSYNLISNTHYYPAGGQTLDRSGLAGAFAPSNYSSSPIILGDELLVFDNSVAQLNKAPSKIYYVDANSGAWQSIPPGGSGSDVVFTPGTGVVIRKAPGFVTPTYWIDPYP